ncbi:Tn7-like element transposition protein TnsE [Microbulbifer sp. OS29]|uniref:Tn7-like element transposition protein TnsE n=1 Tax=Microbulbifer okhotskensis TaxID=2926617 RepID=A0A9X2EW91_9GAMM|nr:Tn7-like element transposition protein TnsE [Microbulbifer okhotskensis]MCO1336618.1 Tn7-like element transposition protein TnsE [Microbulbifer okhotskensis]
MSEIDEIGIRGVPKGSKLMVLGDWYRKAGQEWRVVSYFQNQEKGYFRKSLPIDCLPALTPGKIFPMTSVENKAQGWTETIKLPEQNSWQRVCFRNLPNSLRRAQGFSSQFDDCFIYKINTSEKVYWLPVSELARMLFFHSAEVARAAVNQGNTWQLGKAWKEDWTGEVKLSSNIPVRYLNSLQFRKFFIWLFFFPEVEKSFGSIFQNINRYTKLSNNSERWTFDFNPPDLSHCEFSFAGFTGREFENNHVYIREIRYVSGLKPPDIDTINFPHPDDKLLLEDKLKERNESKSALKIKPLVNISELDPDNRPKASIKRYMIKLSRSGLNFEVEIDTRRSPRHVNVLPHNIDSDLLDEIEEQTSEELGSLLEGSDQGKGVRVDVDNLDPPDLIDAPEKIVFFQEMLDKLKDKHGWKIESKIGDVPQMRCRTQHLVDNRPRRYCHAVIEKDQKTFIQILEIELTNKTKKDGTEESESLSTLFFRAGDTKSTYLDILDELMTSYKDEGLAAMSWKRNYISEYTSIQEYLAHPDNKIISENDALNSWVERAAQKIIGM